jgi:uracil-DNA glycosylase
VDARERLRAYLEQRRELGESELVLDALSTDDVMRMVGAIGRAPSSTGGAPTTSDDWRNVLAASGSAPGTSAAPVRPVVDDVAARPSDSGEDVSEAAADVAPVRPSFARPIAPMPVPRDVAPAAPRKRWRISGIEYTAGLRVDRSPTLSTDPAWPSLGDVVEAIGGCRACPLHATATKHVPGVGNPEAEVLVVGEAPGEQEDLQGEPFVGPAGQLLTKILGAINLPRESVYICNVLKHRPPGNRNPLPDEVRACAPFLQAQIDLVQPKMILAFGTFAAQSLLNTKLAIGKLRQQVHAYQGIPLIASYHPAALLRNDAWKRPTWDDMKLARRILDATERA